MQKKIVLFLLAVCIILAGYVVGMRLKMDKTGPEITFDDGLSYQEGMDEEELLDGVKAHDETDGDVSESLVVESVYPVDDTKVVVVYVAMDSQNNITKTKRELSCDKEKKDAKPTESPAPADDTENK